MSLSVCLYANISQEHRNVGPRSVFFVDLRIQTYTEAVPLKCGINSPRNVRAWIYGYFLQRSVPSSSHVGRVRPSTDRLSRCRRRRLGWWWH